MGDPGCWRRPPSRSDPVSIDANPISSMSFAAVAFAFGPIEDDMEANVAGPRELLTATWCPAFAKSFAAVPPMCPVPTIPIRIPASPERAGEDVRELRIFGLQIRFALSTEN